jgi:putative ABC transport system ATP-binding protein
MGEHFIKAINNINLEINYGDFISIMGPSGSGKTTFLNLIGCIDRPTKGDIIFEGRNINNLSEKELDIMRLKKIGFVFQAFNLLPNLSAFENVALPLEIAKVKKKEVEEKTRILLEKVGLKDRMFHKPFQLSAGEQQRVGIARALSNSPILILADEPTGNLDSKTRDEILEIFKELNKEGKTIVISTHSYSVAENCKKVIKLKDGEIIEIEERR